MASGPYPKLQKAVPTKVSGPFLTHASATPGDRCQSLSYQVRESGWWHRVPGSLELLHRYLFLVRTKR